jgi:peptidoglycan/LPS O-acetylase OafA/YrhL
MGWKPRHDGTKDASYRAGRHLETLDGIRGIAIAAVLLYHVVTLGYPVIGSPTAAFPIEKAVLGVAEYGWLGVDLFFALSGFLITGILTDTREYPRYFRTFFARRALRIFPLYYVSLFLLLIVGPQLYAPLKQRLIETPNADFWAWTYLINVRMAFAGVTPFPQCSITSGRSQWRNSSTSSGPCSCLFRRTNEWYMSAF